MNTTLVLITVCINRLRGFHDRDVRSMNRIKIAYTMNYNIKSTSFFERLGIYSFDSYYNRRLFPWAGHVVHIGSDAAQASHMIRGAHR